MSSGFRSRAVFSLPFLFAQPVRLEHLHLPALPRHLELQPVLEPALAGHEELVIARLLALLLLERHALCRELGGALAALGARAGRVDDALRGHGACVYSVWGGCPTCFLGCPAPKAADFRAGFARSSRAKWDLV